MRAQLADAIREAIRQSGLSINELARQSDVSKGIISRVLRCKRTITVETAEKLLTALGCSIDIKRKKKS